MTARIMMGKRGSDYGLWISRPGVDVTTATDDSDFLLSPNSILTKPYMIGTIVASQGTQVSTKIAHNLGYVPCAVCFGYMKYVDCQMPFKIDSTYIYINGNDTNFKNEINVTYVIFKDKLTDS